MCLAAPAHAKPTTLAIPGGTLRLTQHGAATVLDLTQQGRHTRATLPTDDGIYPHSLDTAKLLGAIPGQVLILSIDHASRPGGPTHMCGAGTETVLRVIALRPTPHQTFHQFAASCWNTIEEGTITWASRDRTLTVERTTYTATTEHRRTQYRIAPNGTATPGTVENLP